MKAMTKYQLEHFKTKVKDKFAPMIEEADLSLRKIVADMTESAEKKLSDKNKYHSNPMKTDEVVCSQSSTLLIFLIAFSLLWQ